MAKNRSSQDFAQTYAGYKHGIGISTENFIHAKVESVAGTFVAPSIGTQGKSVSDATPSTDISASANSKLRAEVDGNAFVEATLVPAGKTTGSLIAAELETKINTALSAAGLDSRVWVEFTSGVYRIWSQKTGAASAVVITAGATVDIAAELKLGVANTGVETEGTAGGDFLKVTAAGLKVGQPFEMSEHRSGRQASNIIKKKKVADGDLELYLNVGSDVTPTIDTPLALLLEGILGKMTNSGSEIKFDSSQAPNKYMSLVQGNNAFGRQFNGGYPKSMTVTLPGDVEAKLKIPMKARDGKYATIAQVNGAVSASASVILNSGESKGFDLGSRVMVVKADGRTVTHGADGSLLVNTRTDSAHTLVLSTTVDVEDDGFIAPWLPSVFDQVGTDNPVTGLEGTVSFDNGSTTVEEIRSVEISFDHKIEDQDNWYGFDTNKGFVVADKAEIMLTVEMLVSASQVAKIVQAKEFATYAMTVVCGPATGRRWQFKFPKVYFEVPETPIPNNGSVVMSLKGKAVQSQDGALDAISVSLL